MPRIVYETLELAKQQYTLQGVNYVLCEVTGLTGARYRDALMQRSRTSEDGKVTTMDGVNEMDIVIIAENLYLDLQTEPDGAPILGEKVAIEAVRQWPNYIVEEMSDKAREMSRGLSSKGKDSPTSASSQTDGATT